MYEAILTLVMLDELGYPVTKVFRIEFDTKRHMEDWYDTSDAEGVVAVQEMSGEVWKNW